MNSGELDNARHAGFMEAVREMKNFVNCEQARLKGESEGFWSGAILGRADRRLTDADHLGGVVMTRFRAARREPQPERAVSEKCLCGHAKVSHSTWWRAVPGSGPCRFCDCVVFNSDDGERGHEPAPSCFIEIAGNSRSGSEMG